MDYGRTVEGLIQKAKEIEDREQRNLAAQTIVEVMSRVVPRSRENAGWKRRMWDHMMILADWELDVDWYEDTMPIEVKRETIKTAQLIKEHRGTKWAVEQVATNSFGDATVLEWYEYGGKPFHFKVSTSYPLDTQALIDKFRKQINFAKRASTVLEEVEFYYNGTLNTYMFAGVLGTSVIYSATAT